MTTFTCAVSGKETEGKHYVLRTTEGEELICPEALFNHRAYRDTLRLVVDLTRRLEALEERLSPPRASEPGPVQDAPPQTKRAPAKRAPRQRKAAD